MLDPRELLCQAWLSCADSLGTKGRALLKETYGTAQAAFDHFSPKARELVGDKAYDELSRLRSLGLEPLAQSLEKSGIKLTMPGEEHFPSLLTQIPDPPELLFYQGSLQVKETLAIAIVGSRRETRYGREQAYQIARELAAQGVTIISGLARGIDTAAHLGALDAKGRTIGILGSGLKRMYPVENQALAERIINQGGAVVSEYAPKSEPLAYHFPFRNRLVSGFANGLLLVEAREKSGTLITVGHSLLQGREVFALPGPVDAPGSAVPHRMLREGARICTCARDILEDMGYHTQAAPEQTEIPLPDLTNDQRRLYDALCHEQSSFHQLMQALDVPAQQLNVLLTTLEMDGLIQALPGKMFRAVKR